MIDTTPAAAAKKDRKADLEHHNMEATRTPSDPMAVQGKLDFESKCLACHSIGQGKKMGPDLAGLTKRRTDDWIVKWMTSPEKMLATDAEAKAMLKEYNNIPMPNQNLTPTEVQQYLRYFHWIDAQPAGSVTASGAH